MEGPDHPRPPLESSSWWMPGHAFSGHIRLGARSLPDLVCYSIWHLFNTIIYLLQSHPNPTEVNSANYIQL
eukprot:7558706-Pyramimonas_sp.AAC.1